MCVGVDEELYAHKFWAWPGILIVKGVEGVHALHVLQFAAVILCVKCKMTKGFEMSAENSLRMFPLVPCAPGTSVSWLNTGVTITSQAAASLEQLLHVFLLQCEPERFC